MEIRPIVSALLRNKMAPLLVAIQIALSLAILSNALYIVNLRIDAAHRPSGLADEASTFYMRISSNQTMSLVEQNDNQKRLLQAITSVAGVVSAADVSQMPMSQSGWDSSIALDRKQTQSSVEASMYQSSGSLVNGFGLKLLAGRDFNSADVIEQDPDSDLKIPENVIVTQTLAQDLYPNEKNYIGKSFFWGTGPDAKESHIVGVVERLQTSSAQISAEGEYSMLLPIRTPTSYPMFVIRAEPGQRDRVISEVEAAVRKADVFPLRINTKTTEKDRQIRYGNEMALVWMLVVVSTLLLLITASGIVGMTSLWVSQRRKQIGVRRALGARKIDILRYFITENLIISCMGVVSGSLLAIGLNQLLVSQLELTKLPFSYVFSGAVLFLLLGVGAAYAPSWRAASISPAVATRST
ncbi:ABC transporter permease [Solimicrobium silvestre]|uniref:FtsX-like permease family n=1 Tax=Solimicrobium silvestre TaxID=2099400 RepID=A0A2S9H3R4_9BURK|nr:FtsX-like permease family protein [Solimicrobium silvestre]PRC94622.1 FtsX-like permease family [Solimicrobium silvestre]